MVWFGISSGGLLMCARSWSNDPAVPRCPSGLQLKCVCTPMWVKTHQRKCQYTPSPSSLLQPSSFPAAQIKPAWWPSLTRFCVLWQPWATSDLCLSQPGTRLPVVWRRRLLFSRALLLLLDVLKPLKAFVVVEHTHNVNVWAVVTSSLEKASKALWLFWKSQRE